MGTGEALANWGMTPLGVKVLPWLSLKKERQKIGCGHLIVDHINGFGGWVQFEHQRKGGGEVRGLVYPGVHREVFYLLWGGELFSCRRQPAPRERACLGMLLKILGHHHWR